MYLAALGHSLSEESEERVVVQSLFWNCVNK